MTGKRKINKFNFEFIVNAVLTVRFELHKSVQKNVF